MSWYGYNQDTANIPIGEQDTSHVAGEVTAEQQGEDIFNTPWPAEIVKLTDRLDVIRDELGKLQAKMYPMSKTGMYDPSIQKPKYREAEELQDQMDELTKEENGIQGYLAMVYEGFEVEPVSKAFPSY